MILTFLLIENFFRRKAKENNYKGGLEARTSAKDV
jgi:hypothetical protein